jgi:hypothetical protein
VSRCRARERPDERALDNRSHCGSLPPLRGEHDRAHDQVRSELIEQLARADRAATHALELATSEVPPDREGRR